MPPLTSKCSQMSNISIPIPPVKESWQWSILSHMYISWDFQSLAGSFCPKTRIQIPQLTKKPILIQTFLHINVQDICYCSAFNVFMYSLPNTLIYIIYILMIEQIWKTVVTQKFSASWAHKKAILLIKNFILSHSS